MHDIWTRRAILAGGLTSLAISGTSLATTLSSKRFQLKETAGLRRFGFPIHVIVPGLDPASSPFRLRRDGKDVPAQFRAARHRSGKDQLALDFNASLGPEETETYEIVPASESFESGRSPMIEREGTNLTVNSGLVWNFQESVDGVLRGARGGKTPYLAGDSLVLAAGTVEGREAKVISEGPLSVIRQGPLAVGLRQQLKIIINDKDAVDSTIDLTLPSSKSWIEVEWLVNDPQHRLRSLRWTASLAIGDGPTLVDLGAQSTMYMTLKPQERIIMMMTQDIKVKAYRPLWTIEKKRPDGVVETLAIGHDPAEGWAHVMDRTRATAIGFDKFSPLVHESQTIDIQGDGKVVFESVSRESAGPNQRLHSWFHFVPMPVQVGALTSPQSMMNPPQVHWLA